MNVMHLLGAVGKRLHTTRILLLFGAWNYPPPLQKGRGIKGNIKKGIVLEPTSVDIDHDLLGARGSASMGGQL